MEVEYFFHLYSEDTNLCTALFIYSVLMVLLIKFQQFSCSIFKNKI